MPTLQTVLVLLHQYGYALLFLFAVIEGPIITILGIFLATQGYFNVFAVYIVVVLGDLSGDLIYYCVGRFGRKAFLGRWENTGTVSSRFKRLERYFKRHGLKALLYAKYTQTGAIALPAAGAARMRIGTFLWCNAVATLPKSFGLALVGYFFGYAYNQINTYLERFALLAFAVACLIGGYLFLRQFRHIEP